MKICLKVHGREMIFSEEERFDVNPCVIDQSYFKQKKDIPEQEKTRLLILEAFEEMKKSPEKYARPFQTMYTGDSLGTPCADLKEEYAKKHGDKIADWVEQALEWAQRIQNGETWDKICNFIDTAWWARLIRWKNNYYRIVGGGGIGDYRNPVTHVESVDICSNYYMASSPVVPLIVRYKK